MDGHLTSAFLSPESKEYTAKSQALPGIGKKELMTNSQNLNLSVLRFMCYVLRNKDSRSQGVQGPSEILKT